MMLLTEQSKTFGNLVCIIGGAKLVEKLEF